MFVMSKGNWRLINSKLVRAWEIINDSVYADDDLIGKYPSAEAAREAFNHLVNALAVYTDESEYVYTMPPKDFLE